MNRKASRLAIVAGLLVSGIAAAAPAPLPSRVVRYNDLDLTSARDVATLYVRLHTAAGLACGEEYRPGGNFIDTAWKVCVATVVDAGVRQVDRPALTAYHAARTAAPSLIRIAKRS